MFNYFFKMSLVALSLCVYQGRAALRCRLLGGWHLMQDISSFPILMLMKLRLWRMDGWSERRGCGSTLFSVTCYPDTRTHIKAHHQEHYNWEGQWTQLNLVEHSGSHWWVRCSWLISLLKWFGVVLWSRTDDLFFNTLLFFIWVLHGQLSCNLSKQYYCHVWTNGIV